MELKGVCQKNTIMVVAVVFFRWWSYRSIDQLRFKTLTENVVKEESPRLSSKTIYLRSCVEDRSKTIILISRFKKGIVLLFCCCCWKGEGAYFQTARTFVTFISFVPSHPIHPSRIQRNHWNTPNRPREQGRQYHIHTYKTYAGNESITHRKVEIDRL